MHWSVPLMLVVYLLLAVLMLVQQYGTPTTHVQHGFMPSALVALNQLHAFKPLTQSQGVSLVPGCRIVVLHQGTFVLNRKCVPERETVPPGISLSVAAGKWKGLRVEAHSGRPWVQAALPKETSQSLWTHQGWQTPRPRLVWNQTLTPKFTHS